MPLFVVFVAMLLLLLQPLRRACRLRLRMTCRPTVIPSTPHPRRRRQLCRLACGFRDRARHPLTGDSGGRALPQSALVVVDDAPEPGQLAALLRGERGQHRRQNALDLPPVVFGVGHRDKKARSREIGRFVKATAVFLKLFAPCSTSAAASSPLRYAPLSRQGEALLSS